MELIEKENPKLKRILNKNYATLQIEQSKLADLLDLIATIPFTHNSLKAKDILGHVYEYFLGEFASAEGKKGGQFYTPKSIVNLMVEMIDLTKEECMTLRWAVVGFLSQVRNSSKNTAEPSTTSPSLGKSPTRPHGD